MFLKSFLGNVVIFDNFWFRMVLLRMIFVLWKLCWVWKVERRVSFTLALVRVFLVGVVLFFLLLLMFRFGVSSFGF